MKYSFAFCAAGYATEMGTLDSVLNLKYFIQADKFRWPTQYLLLPRNIPSFSFGPLGIWCGPLWCLVAHVDTHNIHGVEW
jgi:hypothetical protein